MSEYVIQKREACPRCNGSGRETGPLGTISDQTDDITCHMCKDGSIYTEVDLAVALGDFGLIAAAARATSSPLQCMPMYARPPFMPLNLYFHVNRIEGDKNDIYNGEG